MRFVVARCRSIIVAATAVASALGARQGCAQSTEGADRLPPHAVAESLNILRGLDDAAARNSKEAAMWYHRGMLAWSLWERSRHLPPVAGLDWTSLAKTADESLRNALELDPNNEAYFLAVARFLTGSGVAFRVYGPYGVFNDRLNRARKSGDLQLIADAALEAGHVSWLKYDRIACQAMFHGRGLRPPDTEGAGHWVTEIGGQVLTRMHGPAGPFAFLAPEDNDYAGETDYLKAELLFREAYDAAPERESAFRRLAALLADQKRWRELATLGHNQVHRVPGDPWAWMTLGLATHRLGESKAAVAAFDSAFQRFPPDERKRLDRIERVLGPVDALNYKTMTDSSRAVTAAFYWKNQQPLWSVEGMDTRIEFLARIAFAELRWTEEEINLNGISSDFGAYYVRTGNRWASDAYIRPDDQRQDICTPQVQAWYFGNDTTALPGPAARWTNLARIRIDTIPTQVARFRAGADSADVLFATLPPVAAIARVAQVTGPVRTDFWLLAGGLAEVVHDSVRPSSAVVEVFVHRLPAGTYVYRTEATADGAAMAARGTGGVIAGPGAHTGFALTRFGLSDVLLATRAEARGGPAHRWTDFDITPLVGPVSIDTPISLVWENYELEQLNGSARYGVSIVIQHDATPAPLQRNADGRGLPAPLITSGRIAAAIVSKDAGKIGVKRTGDDVEFSFERTVPYAPIIPDNVAISLGKTPPGNYVLTLRVIDRVTGLTASRSQRLRVPAPPPPKPCLYCKR